MNFEELKAHRNRERERGTILVLPSSAESTAMQEPEPPRLQPLGVTDFLKLDIKPREMLLGPILPQKGLVMLYGVRCSINGCGLSRGRRYDRHQSCRQRKRHQGGN
jgi:hypothetical protein